MLIEIINFFTIGKANCKKIDNFLFIFKILISHYIKNVFLSKV